VGNAEKAEFCSPPERLRRILHDAVEDAGLRGVSTGNVLCRVMEYEQQDDRPAWHRAFLELSDLVVLSAQYVENRVPEFASAPHAEAFRAIHGILQQFNLDSQWDSYRGQLQPIVRLSLPFIVHSGDPAGAVTYIDSSELEEIAAAVDDLAATVVASDLPPLLKQQLSFHLAELHAALTRYRVAGLEGLATKTAMVLSTMTVQSDAARSRPDILEKGLSIATKVQDVILKTAGLYSLAKPVVDRLLGAG
jgi:hypothetical protein